VGKSGTPEIFQLPVIKNSKQFQLQESWACLYQLYLAELSQRWPRMRRMYGCPENFRQSL